MRNNNRKCEPEAPQSAHWLFPGIDARIAEILSAVLDLSFLQ